MARKDGDKQLRMTFLSPAQIEQRRAAGRALVEKRGRAYMAEIGSAGYFSAGQKIGFETLNKMLFGKHLTKGQAKAQRRLD